MRDDTFQDDILFDRLVDGELSADERRRLLESLDARPEGWRRCALAWLESQAWGKELRQLAHPERDAATPPAATTSPRGHATAGRTHRPTGAWLAIAASLLVAFTLGAFTSGLVQRDRTLPIATVSTAPADQIAGAAAPSENTPSGMADDAITLWVRDDRGQSRPLRVPLVDAGTLDRELGLEFQTSLSPELRSRLHDRGYDVQSRRRYAPLWFDNGPQMLVPVEDTKIVPVSRDIY